jgi:glycerol-3-phosphate dehydrogenase subunit B
MSDADVVVVGGGLAGRIAALAAARRDASASVCLVADRNWDFRRQSACIDVLGYAPDGGGPLSNPFDAIGDLPAAHPYRIVGTETVRSGLSLFDDVLGDGYGGATTEQNALVATAFGRVRPVARYPTGTAAGLASERRETTLVGCQYLPEFDAPTAAERLEQTVSYRVDGITVQFPTDAHERIEMAETLDDNPITPEADPAREALAATVRMYQSGEERIGLPPVLGLREHDAVRAQFEEAFGVPVFEVPAGPPHVPGIRLGRTLEGALDEAGVDVLLETHVEEFDASDGHVERLHRRDGGTVTGSQFVLATGGLERGGIVTDRTSVTEPLFGCHVAAPSDRGDWADRAPLGDHPFARFGVSVDGDLRPLGVDEAPEYANLRAAGHVLGGYDPVAEHSGSGVAIATGYAAGRRAVENS